MLVANILLLLRITNIIKLGEDGKAEETQCTLNCGQNVVSRYNVQNQMNGSVRFRVQEDAGEPRYLPPMAPLRRHPL